ncbi:MAG: hydrogenase maturation protease [Verrucomicrobiae bacterium]|nr:hydrogenase maturation protease [Verrucomicrobiae bacterium]
MPPRALVLGYGNPDRNDDGAGWAAIEALHAGPPPDTELDTAHQLEVEMAERIASFDRVVFVDAAVPEFPEPLAIFEIAPGWRSHATAHHLTPGDLLALAETLYGKKPRVTLVTIRGRDFHFGSTLSPETRAAVEEAVQRIRALLSEA